MRLLLEEVTESGYRPLATLDGRSYRVGRDLTTDIPFSSTALSRQHAIFVPFDSGWVFKDLGSTNGSWHNGTRLAPQIFVPLKEGDFLQLADAIVKIKYEGKAGDLKGPRLMVVVDGEALREIPFSEFNPIIAVGGDNAQLPVAGYDELAPLVRFEFVSGTVTCTPSSHRIRTILNGEDAQGNARILVRGDVIAVGEYECIYIDTQLTRYQGEPRPFPLAQSAQPHVDLTEVPQPRNLHTSAAESEPRVFSPVHTVAMKSDPQRIWRFGEAPQDDEEDPWAARNPKPVAPRIERNPIFDFERMSDAERRLVFGIIFFLGSTVLLFLIWLLFL